MTLTFITNYLTHHTSPLSEALYGWLGAGFRFVETRPLRAGRVELGWQPEQDRPYLLRAYQGPEVAARCRHLALGSDVVLLGSAPDSWILPRLRQNRLTFRYGERWYKTGPPGPGLGPGCTTAASGGLPCTSSAPAPMGHQTPPGPGATQARPTASAIFPRSTFTAKEPSCRRRTQREARSCGQAASFPGSILSLPSLWPGGSRRQLFPSA